LAPFVVVVFAKMHFVHQGKPFLVQIVHVEQILDFVVKHVARPACARLVKDFAPI
jgi:hypothetical protein